MNVVVFFRSINGSAVRKLGPGAHTVGRDESASVRMADPDVSRCHLTLEVGADDVVVRDAGSANGTWRGRRRIDAVRLPWYPLRLRLGPSAAMVMWRRPVRTIVRTAHVGVALVVCAMFIFVLAYTLTTETTKRTCADSMDMERRLRRATATGDHERGRLLLLRCRVPRPGATTP